MYSGNRMLPQGQGQGQGQGQDQIRFMTPQWREEFENFYFGRIQEFHDCYVKNDQHHHHHHHHHCLNHSPRLIETTPYVTDGLFPGWPTTVYFQWIQVRLACHTRS